ncbi:MAG: UDP-N-acetylmuramate:L-alanyl-gamma-D-glutamyl-meso-diaminopimelate ligase [Burkholderiaceae bacterium]
MHIHILGICGTFMGGLAQLAQAAGFRVTGCDTQVYPPMSDQLGQAGIELIEGFEVDQLALKPDLFVVGNVARRGLPLVEAILNQRLAMTSGPSFLSEHLLGRQRIVAVAGTHGKTTTTALIAYLLDACGAKPGFLVGGVPENFGVSARLAGAGAPFVIEADEYDTAFFDKRSKFLHYRAEVAVLNNLEFDHADIFTDLAAIETQFHHWVRTLPSEGRLVVHAQEPAIDRVLARGCYTPVWRFDAETDFSETGLDFYVLPLTVATSTDHAHLAEHEALELWREGRCLAQASSPLWGLHNRRNLAAALAAVTALGLDPVEAFEAVKGFKGIKRRMQQRGQAAGVRVFDDFAHHPTAIATTVQALRAHLPEAARLLAVLEPRSNTMKMGLMRDQLAGSLAQADQVFAYSRGLNWSLEESLASLRPQAFISDEIDRLVASVVKQARPGDAVLVMSNGGFEGIHERLLQGLTQAAAS